MAEVRTDEVLAFDSEPCPHNEEDSEWQEEIWADSKTTGYEIRICRDCLSDVERRPLKELTDMVLPLLGQLESAPNVFDMIGHALLTIDIRRLEETTEGILQEVGHGENISKDSPSPR